MKRLWLAVLTAAVTISMSGCLSPSGDTPAMQRANARREVKRTLAELYKSTPKARNEINNSAGYVVFDSVAVALFFFPTENGWAAAYNRKNGKVTYLKGLSLGIGPGLGVASMRNIYIFKDEASFTSFLNSGWGAHAQANAVARFSDEGTAAAAGSADIARGTKTYKIGKKGLIAQATIMGAKAWKNDSL